VPEVLFGGLPRPLPAAESPRQPLRGSLRPTAYRLLSVMSRASERRSSTALRRISGEFIAGHGF
jgi:hypothetical protein